jgi:DNA-binding CsgD family transcriptional regulator
VRTRIAAQGVKIQLPRGGQFSRAVDTRLEYAKALIDIGAALRRAGHHNESHQNLHRGVEIAHICGASPLVERGKNELRASGIRLPEIAPWGPDALSPSERRVAELAAAGYSDRDIAQALFITTNTVEIHLTAIYDKLGINGRANLASVPFRFT